MFDKIGQAAERAAAGVSRRNFLGQLGRGAAALAAGLGGVLRTAGDAQAGGNGKCCMTGLGGCTRGPCKGDGSFGGGGTTIRCSDFGTCPSK